MRLAEEAERWGVLCGRARLLARRFWAGGLTLVVPYRGEGFAPRGVVTDMGSIALRVPSHGLLRSRRTHTTRTIRARRRNPSAKRTQQRQRNPCEGTRNAILPYPSQRREEQTPRRDTEQLKSTRQPKNDAQAT